MLLLRKQIVLASILVVGLVVSVSFGSKRRWEVRTKDRRSVLPLRKQESGTSKRTRTSGFTRIERALGDAGDDANDGVEDQGNDNDDLGEENQDQNYSDGHTDDGAQADDYYSDDKQGNDRNTDATADNERNSRDEGLKFDDKIYVDDDYVDDYYAFQEDPGDPHLFPLSAKDVFGFFIASIGVMLAAGGGIGGGGIVVPCYIIVMEFAPRAAIPLSAVTVLGGSVASTMLNWRRRHPLADRPVIDWNLVLIMEPVVLVGAMVGSLLHRVLSEKLLVVLLVALLSITAHTTLTKAKRMWEAEKLYIERIQKHVAAQKVSSPEAQDYDPPVPPPTSTGHHGEHSLQTNVRQQILILNPDFVSLRSDMLEGEKVTPRSKIIALCSMFSVLIFLNIMVGGGAFQSPWGIRCGSLPFWVVHIIIAAFLIASAWAAQTYLVNQHEMKELIQFDYVHGDIKFDSRGAVIYPLIFCSAGLFAGIFGIGGGMICVPMLLGMGVHPVVATATSSCMIMFTSVASTTSFVIFDLLYWDYAIVCLIIGFFPTLLGQSLMAQARFAGKFNGHNFERNSIIAYSIGGVVLLSALLMTIQYVFSIISLEEPSDSGGLCEGYQRGAV